MSTSYMVSTLCRCLSSAVSTLSPIFEKLYICVFMFLYQKKNSYTWFNYQQSFFLWSICFSSPQLKAEVSFSDQLAAFTVCPSVCLYVCKPFTLSTCSPESSARFEHLYKASLDNYQSKLYTRFLNIFFWGGGKKSKPKC